MFRAGCELVPRDDNLLVRKLKEIFKHVYVERKNNLRTQISMCLFRKSTYAFAFC